MLERSNVSPDRSKKSVRTGVVFSARPIDLECTVPTYVAIQSAQIINTYIYPNADVDANANADTFRPKNGLIFELQTSRSDEIDQRAEL